MRWFAGAVFGLVATAAVGSFASFSPAVLSSSAVGLPTIPARERIATGSGSIENGFWTGWVDVSRYCSAHIEGTLTDANDSVSNVVMRCEESIAKGTANDAGADTCCRSIAAGVETYTCPCSKKVNFTAGGSWSWTVENLHSLYLNCNFTGEGTVAAADTVAWKIFGEHCR